MQTDPAPSSSPPSTPPPPPQRQVHAALQLLKGPSDEARFAGLLMMVKHLNKDNKGTSAPPSSSQEQQQQQQQQEEENEIRRQVHDAVTPQFLARLLVSSSSTTTSSTSPFRSVALAIIAALMQDASLVPRLRPLLKHVLVVMDSLCVEKGLMVAVEEEGGGDDGEEEIKMKKAEEESRNQLLEDCLFYIYSLAKHDQSALCVEALAAQQAFGRVFTCVETLAMKIRANATKSQEAAAGKEKEGGEDVAAVEEEAVVVEEDEKDKTSTTTTTTTTDTDADNKLLTQACATLREMALLEEAGNGTYGWILLLDQSESNDTNTFTRIARLLNQESSQLKLHLLHLLSLLLSHRRGRSGWWVDRQTHTHTQAFASFGQAMRPALVQLLHGGLREAHRDPALALLVHMLHLFGQGWAVEEDKEAQTHTHTHTHILPRGSSAGFFVAALAAETRMAAEELETLANVGEEIIHTDTTLQRRLVRAREMLPLCLDGLDAVLRFLCSAEESESECVSVCGKTEPEKRWESLPGAVLLNMRGSIHEAVGALIKLVQDAAREWKLSGGGGGGGGWGGKREENEKGEREGEREGKGGEGEEEEEEMRYLEPVVRFLTAVVAEDEACMKVEEALSVLPFVMFLVEGHTHAHTQKVAGGWSSLWVLPWISRVLAEEGEGEGGDGDTGTALFRLVDECRVHLWLAENLMMYTTNTAAASTTRGLLPPATGRMIEEASTTEVSAGEEQAQIDMLFALQELLARGGRTIPCEDCGCLLMCHPEIIEELVPCLCACMCVNVNMDGSTPAISPSFRLRLYRLWFVLSLLVEEDEMMVGKILPVGGKAREAVVEAVGEMVLNPEVEREVCMLMLQEGGEGQEEEGEEGEVQVLWRRVRELVTVGGVGRVLGVRGGR